MTSEKKKAQHEFAISVPELEDFERHLVLYAQKRNIPMPRVIALVFGFQKLAAESMGVKLTGKGVRWEEKRPSDLH